MFQFPTNQFNYNILNIDTYHPEICFPKDLDKGDAEGGEIGV